MIFIFIKCSFEFRRILSRNNIKKIVIKVEKNQ